MDNVRSSWVCPPVAPDVTARYALEGTSCPVTGVLTASAWDSIWAAVSQRAAENYIGTCGSELSPYLVEFKHGPATYLFDDAGRTHTERTVLVAGRPQVPDEARDVLYQAGYPLPDPISDRPLDRGHFMPYSGGGLFGPNMFAQDRALNRGWSRQGRLYRALERRAIATQGAVLLACPIYGDESDVPAAVDLGVVDGDGCVIHRFRNRYDLAGGGQVNEPEDELAIALNGAVSAQIGALGEETAAVFLADEVGATIVALGDAGMPRNGSAQDLDIIAIVNDELVVFEVKTRFMSRTAGRRTRAGNLPRPRMRRSATPATPRQASQDYVATRLRDFLDVDDNYAGTKVRVLAVDFCLMQIQQFAIDSTGTRLAPVGPPVSCVQAARVALATILEHRGYL